MNNTKKGFILMLDLALGLSIVFIILAITIFYVSRGSESDLAEYQLLILGSDIVHAMDQEKTFDSLDYTEIEVKMEELLPANYDMLLRIQGDFNMSNGTIELGGEVPQNRLVAYGRRLALTENNTYLKITYALWLREN